MQHGGCGAWHALCHGPVYAWHDGSCERAVCVKCGHVGREEVRGRKKWDVEPQSPNPCPSASRPRNARESVDCGDVREGFCSSSSADHVGNLDVFRIFVCLFRTPNDDLNT